MTTSTSSAPPAGARNATLEDLAALLRDQQARKVDIVAPATAIHADEARLVVRETEPVLGPGGVTMTTGAYTPTDVPSRRGHARWCLAVRARAVRWSSSVSLACVRSV